MKRHVCVLLALAWTLAVQGASITPATYRIETVAGSANLGDGGPATAAQLSTVQGIAVDRLGNLYLSDTDNQRVRKISTGGVITTIAGTGVAGFSGDGGQATAAQLNTPYGLAADLAGNLYVADYGNNRVRRIGPDGVITTVAGGGTGDIGAATGAQLVTPRNVAVDAAGNLYFSEFERNRVRKVTPAGIISTVAGTGLAGYNGDGGSAVNAQLYHPAGLAVDRFNALYIADSRNNRVRKILTGGVISTYLGDSVSTPLYAPVGIAVDIAGTLYVVDDDVSHLIHSYTVAGAWTNVGVTTQPNIPRRDVAVDLNGVPYFADGVFVRKVANGQVQTVAGDGYLHAIGDGGLATNALLLRPSAIALDSAGSLYIADTGTQRVRQVLPTGMIRTLAGTGVAGAAADNVLASAATLNGPSGIAIDAAGDIVIADEWNQRVRQVTADGRIHNLAGTGNTGAPMVGTPAQTPLSEPYGVCTGRGGALFVVVWGSNVVLQTAPQALVITAAGNGTPGNTGDGGPAYLAQLNAPSACALDSAGNLFIADTGNHGIRKVAPSGTISTVAGVGAPGFSGDGGPATSAGINAPLGVAVDDTGDIFIADTGNNRIRQVTPDGVIHTIAGQNAAAFGGDGGPALSAQITAPGGLFLDGAGDLYFADTGNNRVRRLVPEAAPAPPAPVVAPPLSAVSAASFLPGPIAPGELIVIFGAALGPQSGVAGALDSSGILANLLAGAEVRFDGVPAPMFYAQFGQLNVQVPYTVAGNTATHVQTLYQGSPSGSLDLAVAIASPAVFPVVVNLDGSLNSQTAPTALGSIVTFYATGEGLTNGPNVSGQAAAAPYPSPLLPVTVTVAGFPAQILYAGAAPGEVGLLQINARVPAGFIPTGPAVTELAVGSFVALDFTIWLK